ncbi:ABC transporter substrate-binding protein [Desulfomonile tiedjei]|uniref:ABC-type Fe3+-hydroxamate transport system, periplasmic component n=1 Tax=Desulfomonile tiedjei (strain ATCC 49306 / DSM 6799 / DCB-1) TaxID=706587 RepID=I4CER1_DESTA|nr:ABC transporter substrate-binding protein [Desulfomonile tiedjei]AFM28052.1 ABC-type Fe3+-hydroxamate transport system, periplasmic component [Desulfomonile tiedjei DSM 6799]
MKIRNITIIFALSVLVPAFVVGADAETLTYTDKLGRVVTIPVPVSRAVVFQTYELIPALGIWDKIVGVGRYAYSNDLMVAARPDITSTIPSAGSGVDVSAEVLMKLEPDVVITWTFQPEAIRFIEQKGLRVIGVSPEGLTELYEVMRLHGTLFGKEQRAEIIIKEMEKIFGLVRERVSEIPAQGRKKVLWLFGKPTQVACKTGVPNSLIELMRGINPASDIPQTSSDISMEQIIAWNPDVIFIWGHAGYMAQDILDSDQWRRIRAVYEGRVFKAPRWSNWSPRIAPVALWMAMKTYPDLFKNIDVERSFDDFYQEVYGIPYEKVSKFER